mmetsp:Transcript_63881/g.178586  ORF Transcript_63881/g.178586 Transcript_63881/m.178586 type:complete len:234 (+) Transcript_63881:67-768(+)
MADPAEGPAVPSLVLYHYPLTRSVRVLWLLHELGPERVTFTLKRLELLKGEGRSQEFLAKNPNHAVPYVELETPVGERICMFESCAIVQFLADACAPGGLAPAAGLSRARAEYERWMWFAGSWMDQLLWQLRQHAPGGILAEGDRDERIVVRTREKWTQEIEPQVVAQLSLHGGTFILGPEFSAADCVVGHTLRWATAYGLCEPPELQAYLARCAERPAFQSAYADADSFGKL